MWSAGQWAQSVIHPSSNLTKEYLVMVDRPATKTQVKSVVCEYLYSCVCVCVCECACVCVPRG